jgi:hypothetical protein
MLDKWPALAEVTQSVFVPRYNGSYCLCTANGGTGEASYHTRIPSGIGGDRCPIVAGVASGVDLPVRLPISWPSVEEFGVSEAESIQEALELALRDDPHSVPRAVRLAAVEAILRGAQQVVETSRPTWTGRWRREDAYEEREQKLCPRLSPCLDQHGRETKEGSEDDEVTHEHQN